jgi:hypothetical protein
MTVRNFVPHDQFAARTDEKRPVPSLPAVENAFATRCNELRAISLKIHAFAECAYKEYKSAQLLSKYMEDEGFVVERGVAGVETAFTATYTQGTGPVVSFNAVSRPTCSVSDGRNTMRCLKLVTPAAIISLQFAL